jgi:hypothetical protein
LPALTPNETDSQALPRPQPPEKPCVFPTSEDEIRALGEISSLIVRADITEPEGMRDGYLRYEVHIADVIRSDLPSVPTSGIWIVQTGLTPAFTPGSNFLFLQDVEDVDSTFYVSGGMYGAFPIVSDRVGRLCPNYEQPSSPLSAEGESVTAEEFDAFLRASLRPHP